MSAPTRQPVELDFRLSTRDMMAARRQLLTQSWSMRALVAGLLAWLVAAGARGDAAWVVSLLVGLAVSVVGILVVPALLDRRRNPNARAEQRWTLGSDGLRIAMTAPDGERLASTDMEWRSILRVRESRRAYLLACSRTGHLVLPKHALDAATEADVRALLAEHVSGRR